MRAPKKNSSRWGFQVDEYTVEPGKVVHARGLWRIYILGTLFQVAGDRNQMRISYYITEPYKLTGSSNWWLHVKSSALQDMDIIILAFTCTIVVSTLWMPASHGSLFLHWFIYVNLCVFGSQRSTRTTKRESFRSWFFASVWGLIWGPQPWWKVPLLAEPSHWT